MYNIINFPLSPFTWKYFPVWPEREADHSPQPSAKVK